MSLEHFLNACFLLGRMDTGGEMTPGSYDGAGNDFEGS